MNLFDSTKIKLKKIIIKDLKKIKEGLAKESNLNKEMIITYIKFSTTKNKNSKLSKEDMKKANEQFKSFLKTLGLGTIAVLPLAPITIPLIVKLGRKFGIDIIPASFK